MSNRPASYRECKQGTHEAHAYGPMLMMFDVSILAAIPMCERGGRSDRGRQAPTRRHEHRD